MRFPTILAALSWVSQQATTVAAFKASDFKVEGLEKLAPAYAEFQSEGEMYAGLLPIDIEPTEPRGELMFWYFEPENPVASDTLTIFINGGPGCSTMAAGVLFELAPVTVPHHPAGYPNIEAKHYEPLVPNEFSWTNATNMLFVDQPAGVGYTHGPVVQTEEDLAFDFYNFLTNFYDTFPHLQQKRLFLFGESYAGYYVPSIARKIYLENKKETHRHINLAAVGIGNGWMDAEAQVPYMVDYAWYHGVIDSTTRDGLLETYEQCLAGAEMEAPFHEFNIPHECNINGALMSAAGAGILPKNTPNIYDYSTWDAYPVLLTTNATIHEFFNDPAVKAALNVPTDKDWTACLPGGGRRRMAERELLDEVILAQDRPKSTIPYLAELLDDADIRVLVYNGDRDIICNIVGDEMLLNNMSWSGEAEWKTAQRGLWLVNGQPAGYSKSHGNLDFLVVRNSGHLVPSNVPEQSLDMITRYVTDHSFNDANLPSFGNPATTYNEGPTRTAKAAVQPAINTANKFHSLFVLVTGIICFSAGYFVATKRAQQAHGYTPINNVGIEFST